MNRAGKSAAGLDELDLEVECFGEGLDRFHAEAAASVHERAEGRAVDLRRLGDRVVCAAVACDGVAQILHQCHESHDARNVAS